MHQAVAYFLPLAMLWLSTVVHCEEPYVKSLVGYPAKLISEHLPNPVSIHPKIISGGLPEGEAAFAELAERGIKTIISVDGMKPDVELARKYGLRYVHLPHGYDGIPEDRVVELSKAVHDLEGPIYIHCHHGKHRSPAAAAVACVSAGLIPSEQAIPILELAGTNPNYRGLFQVVRDARTIAPEQMNTLNVRFQEVNEIPAMAQAMVDIERNYEHMRMVETSQWQVPVKHPDLEPAHESLLLRDHFAELLRQEETAKYPAEFIAMLEDSEQAAQNLHELLAMLKGLQPAAAQLTELGKLSRRISDNCKACHERFRDNPPVEKRH